MIERPLYLNQLEGFIDKPLIKVIAGIRRAGKSSLLAQIKDILMSRGVPEEKIALINFDSLDYTNIRTKADFVDLEKQLLDKGVHYFLFDELQNIEQWDEAVTALFAEGDVDIYITGSNSKLLSSELSTFFTGRYVDFRVSTLNFQEFRDFKAARGEALGSPREDFEEYMRRGGFPSINVVLQTEAQDDEEVSDILSSIIFRDIVERKNLRNTELLSRVLRFVVDNVGSVFSAKSISDYLKNERLPLSQETIYKYLNWLEEAFVIERVRRYDLRGKVHLKTDEKFYLADVSFLYALNGRSGTYISGVLENIVFHELISHGYKVAIGKNNEAEVDFVVEKNHQKMYLQVATAIHDRETSEREFSAFDGIEDNYPKYVLVLDTQWPYNINGVESKSLPEFLLEL